MQRFPTKPHHLFDEGGRIDRLEVLEGPSGRRTWSEEAKAQIVMESYAPGAKVCDVAQRHGIAPQHLSTWRGLAKKGKLVLPMPDDGEDVFASIEVLADAAFPPVEAGGGGMIEIEAGGAIIRVPLNTDAARVAELALALQAQ